MWWEGDSTEVRSESSSLFWSVGGTWVGINRRPMGGSSVKGAPNLLDLSCCRSNFA